MHFSPQISSLGLEDETTDVILCTCDQSFVELQGATRSQLLGREYKIKKDEKALVGYAPSEVETVQAKYATTTLVVKKLLADLIVRDCIQHRHEHSRIHHHCHNSKPNCDNACGVPNHHFHNSKPNCGTASGAPTLAKSHIAASLCHRQDREARSACSLRPWVGARSI